MANLETIHITLPVELLTEMRHAVEEGEYASDSDIVSEAMKAWKAERNLAGLDVSGLKRAWDEAINHDGPGIPMDEVMDRFEAKYRAMADARS